MRESLTIVKFGGKIIDQPEELEKALTAFSQIKGHKMLVHGGGKLASDFMTKMGMEPKVIDGRRITDEETLEIVTMVYAGLINKNIVASLQAKKTNALGVSGADMNLIIAHKRIVKDIDYGYAGDIDQINSTSLKTLLNQKVVPVFCPITHNQKGQLLNTNADTIASVVAAAMTPFFEVDLLYTFEKNGVMKNLETEEIFTRIDREIFDENTKNGILSEGMLPKLENAFDSVDRGVRKVVICHHEALSNWGTTDFNGTIIEQ